MKIFKNNTYLYLFLEALRDFNMKIKENSPPHKYAIGRANWFLEKKQELRP